MSVKWLPIIIINLSISALCMGQDSINKPSICISLGAERMSMRHQFTGTVNERFRTPLMLAPKASFYMRSVRGKAVKVDLGLIQYSDPSGINNYPTLEAYGHREDVLGEDLGLLSFLNVNLMLGKRWRSYFKYQGKMGSFPIDFYYGLNFQIPVFRDEGNFYDSPLERIAQGSDGDLVFRESRKVIGLMPRLSFQAQKEFKLMGNVNWYLGASWVQGFAPFLQKEWWREVQGVEQDRLGLSYTGSYVGFELGIRGVL